MFKNMTVERQPMLSWSLYFSRIEKHENINTCDKFYMKNSKKNTFVRACGGILSRLYKV